MPHCPEMVANSYEAARSEEEGTKSSEYVVPLNGDVHKTVNGKDFREERAGDPKDFTDIIGGRGPWQNRILLIITFSIIPVAWHHVGITFLAYDTDHWCSRPRDQNVTLQTWWATSLPTVTTDGSTRHSHCERYEWRMGSRKIVPCDQWEYETSFYHSTIISEWDLVCNRAWMVSMSQSVYMAGYLIAVLLFGQLADRYGRRPIMLLNVAILLTSGLATAFSTSFTMFAIMRFFVAMGFSGFNLIVFVLMFELIDAPHRAVYGVLLWYGWIVGYILLPLMAWLVRDWFHLQLLTTMPCILYVSFYWLLPESPRWLLANGKVHEAVEVLKGAAEKNGKESATLMMQVQELRRFTEKEEQVKKSQHATVLDLLKTPNMRKKTLTLYLTWFVISFVYFGLSLNTVDLGGNLFLNVFLSGIVEVPANFLCIVVLKYLGRKWPLTVCMIIGGLACIFCIPITDDLFWLRISFALIGKLCIACCFSIVYVYSAEIYPTVARNIGVGSGSTCARIGSMIAPFMKELGKVTKPSVPMGLFGGLSIISGLMVLLLPDTSDHPVPETLQQAEEFGKKLRQKGKVEHEEDRRSRKEREMVENGLL